MRLIVSVSLIVAGASTMWFMSWYEPAEYRHEFDVTLMVTETTCSNPDIEHNGNNWKTETSIPVHWHGTTVTGRMKMRGGGRAVFHADDGTEIGYQYLGNYSSMSCNLPP